MSLPDPVVPDYSTDGLGMVLPAAADALGVSIAGAPGWGWPRVQRVCVVLVDGLGAQLLGESPKSAPFLSPLLDSALILRAGCPTTTVASIGSFGTGRPPGEHGLVGYEVLSPEHGILLNGLHWDPRVDPLRWQPHRTVFEQFDAAGVSAVRLGPGRFADSGLTQAALRGGHFVPMSDLADGCASAVDALTSGAARLVYLYWGGVDEAGHRYGWQNRHWRDALRFLDRALSRLARRLPAGTLLLVTADHGMVDVPAADRHDLADTPELMANVRLVGGEPRLVQLYTEPGAGAEVAARFTRFEGRAWVRTRDQAIAAGWFGPVSPRVAPRIGDVLIAAGDRFAMVHSRLTDPKVLALIGQHGSLTEAEQLVPLISVLT